MGVKMQLTVVLVSCMGVAMAECDRHIADMAIGNAAFGYHLLGILSDS